jgi:hypothetical protein
LAGLLREVWEVFTVGKINDSLPHRSKRLSDMKNDNGGSGSGGDDDTNCGKEERRVKLAEITGVV